MFPNNRGLGTTTATKVNAPIAKKPAAVAAGDEDSDVSLSDDDDGNDEDGFHRFTRKQSTNNFRKKDGHVAVPTESTVFLNGIQQHQKQQIAKQSVQINRTAAASATLPQRAVSSIGRLHQPQQFIGSLTGPTTSAATATTAAKNSTTASTNAMHSKPISNSILNATSARTSKSAIPNGLKMVGGVLVDTTRLFVNAQDSGSSSSSSSSRSSSAIGTSHTASASSNNKNAKLPQDSSKMFDPAAVEKMIYAGLPYKDRDHGNNNQRQQTDHQTQQTKPSTATTAAAVAAAAAAERVEKKRVEKRKIELLLGMKSSHAEEGEKEWFESFEQRADKMADRELKQQKAASIVSAFVKTCYHCETCQLTTESQVAYTLCNNKGHTVRVAKGIKWFFECGNCRKRDYTLSLAPTNGSTGKNSHQGHNNSSKSNSHHNGSSSSSSSSSRNSNSSNSSSSSGRGKGDDAEVVSQTGQVGFAGKQHPTRRCECGSFDWRSCGRQGSFATDSKEHQVVLSATDWTSRKDLMVIASLSNSAL